MKTYVKIGIVCALIIMVILFAIIGCTSAGVNKIKAYGEEHKVKQYSGGVKVGEWTSTGYVRNEESSDGYFFTDKDTGDLVRVTGTLQITTNLDD